MQYFSNFSVECCALLLCEIAKSVAPFPTQSAATVYEVKLDESAVKVRGSRSM
jgi:hypothetical protein